MPPKLIKHLCVTLQLSFSLALLGCERKSEFGYLLPEANHVVQEHKLKQLTGTRELDILWVIDNSGSMGPSQANVLHNMDAFIDGLSSKSDLHWRTALISTSEREPPYIGMTLSDRLDYTHADGNMRFKEAVRRLGLNGDAEEKTFIPIAQALKNYPNFLRRDAFLAIILVSDADEQSHSMTTTDFVDLLKTAKGDLNKILFYGFLSPIQWCSSDDYPHFDWQGSKFEQLLTTIKGDAFKLCDPQFGKNLATLGRDLARLATVSRIYLNERPVVSSLRVLYNDRDIPGGVKGYWSYNFNSNAVELNDLSFAPGDNESIKVVYDIDDGIER